ncbi:MAG TPA: hypothetical protein VFB62_16315, partial [Polyangiaceae bacterium]|nr:hypothetical protein [Polyangiaceae bacterium]
MRPLDPLQGIERLLHQAPPAEVSAALAALDNLDATAAAAKSYALGALALRLGSLDEAFEHLDTAARRFDALGEREGAALARAEAWLASIRRGPRKVYAEAIDGLQALEAEAGASRLVRVVAAHYRGTALRYAGNAEETLRTLLTAFAASDGLLAERAQVLNSLGTLYVVLGAYGAAQAVLEHGADISGRIGDKVSEAISYGQLGSAALARGALDEARRHLQRQEWLASRVGDAFGQSRALVLLGDLALDAGRPDDALELAGAARRVASSVNPPLGMWMAYATRTIGRAHLEL